MVVSLINDLVEPNPNPRPCSHLLNLTFFYTRICCAKFSNSDNSQPDHPPIAKDSSENGDDGNANLVNNESSTEDAPDEGDESENDNNSSLSGNSNVWTIPNAPLIEITEAYDNGSCLNDEKIYEDLCYVTFSPNSREVHMIDAILICLNFFP
jgi:hypothetical protein